MEHQRRKGTTEVSGLNKPKWALGIVMMVLGLLLTLQFRVNIGRSQDPSRLRSDELIVALGDKEKELEASQARVQDLEQQVAQLRESLKTLTPAPQADSETLRLLAGTLEATGPGVVVTLKETPEGLTAKNKVADEDIWRVLNELLISGAEAISVNDVRLTAVTGIRNVGNRILVNQTMIASPVEIKAIGDPSVLEASLKLRGGVIELLGRWGIEVTVVKNDSLTIPAVKSEPVFRYIKTQESTGS